MAKAKSKKKAPAKRKKAREVLVVGSKVKAEVKAAGLNMAGNAIADGLNDLVHELIAGAIARAKENGRKTVRPHDF